MSKNPLKHDERTIAEFDPSVRSAKGWSEERRARHAEAMHRWKPWEHSTGPRTKRGKTKAKRNASKHGLRSEEWREFLRLLRAQRAFVKEVLRRKT